MVVFQGGHIYFWEGMVFLTFLLMAGAIWYFTIVGRDRRPKHQRRGEATVERFGDLEENHAPIPKFLLYTFAGSAVWGLGYLIWTGINGVTGYK